MPAPQLASPARGGLIHRTPRATAPLGPPAAAPARRFAAGSAPLRPRPRLAQPLAVAVAPRLSPGRLTRAASTPSRHASLQRPARPIVASTVTPNPSLCALPAAGRRAEPLPAGAGPRPVAPLVALLRLPPWPAPPLGGLGPACGRTPRPCL
nr:translation initiation factor IF-2-like [Aegilops tauschii subsp. strangulata]